MYVFATPDVCIRPALMYSTPQLKSLNEAQHFLEINSEGDTNLISKAKSQPFSGEVCTWKGLPSRALQALLLSCSGRFAMLLLRGEGRARAAGGHGRGRATQAGSRSVGTRTLCTPGRKKTDRRSVGRLLRALRATRVGD